MERHFKYPGNAFFPQCWGYYIQQLTNLYRNLTLTSQRCVYVGPISTVSRKQNPRQQAADW